MAERELNENVVEMPPARKPLPARVAVPDDASDGLTPNELRALKEASGKRVDYLMGDADWDEKAQVGVWVALRREGYDPTWDEAGDVLPVKQTAEPDPTSDEPSTGSSGSAASGE